MDQRLRAVALAPIVTRTKADGTRAIPGQLSETLASRRIPSLLPGRRKLVLRTGGCVEPAGTVDPQLYVFAGGPVATVTTGGQAYRFANGRTHAAADPSGAGRGNDDQE